MNDFSIVRSKNRGEGRGNSSLSGIYSDCCGSRSGAHPNAITVGKHYDQEVVAGGGADCAIDIASAIVDRTLKKDITRSTFARCYVKVDSVIVADR